MRTLKYLVVIVLLFGSILLGVYYFVTQKSVIQKGTRLLLKENEKTASVWYSLEEKKAITDNTLLGIVAQLKSLSKVKEGSYFFRKGMSATDVVNMLRAGCQTPVRVTFQNLRTIKDFSDRIAQQLVFNTDSLYKAMTDEKIVKSYGFEKYNFIEMFIPNTYEMYYTISEKQFFDKMYKEYKRFWNTKRQKQLQEIGYTAHQVCIIASIVDEETNRDDEKKRIAGVYINRLKIGIPLQADPTLKFAVGDFTIKRILDKHKSIKSPYNTYKYAGLPPGPIRQPSIAGIEAVLNYEKHKYLYFCAKSDFSGYHVFARNLDEHNRNARKYHKALNRLGIMK